MHEIKHFSDFGLAVVTYDMPFSVSDLMEVAETLGSPGSGKDRHRALLIDLRRVALAEISGDDSRKFIAVRKMRVPLALAEPAAFLIRSSDDFGNIRMHNLWSEAMGHRKEEDTFITVNLPQALTWLAERTSQPALVNGMLPFLNRGASF
jgi:hypothetical protein